MIFSVKLISDIITILYSNHHDFYLFKYYITYKCSLSKPLANQEHIINRNNKCKKQEYSPLINSSIMEKKSQA